MTIKVMEMQRSQSVGTIESVNVFGNWVSFGLLNTCVQKLDLKFPPVCGIFVGFEDGESLEFVCVVCWGVEGGFGAALGWETGFILFVLGDCQHNPDHPLFFPFCLGNFLFPLLLLLSFLPPFCRGLVVPLLFHFVAVSLCLIISRSLCLFLLDHRAPVPHSTGLCVRFLWVSCI